jgi:hypothetical protein
MQNGLFHAIILPSILGGKTMSKQKEVLKKDNKDIEEQVDDVIQFDENTIIDDLFQIFQPLNFKGILECLRGFNNLECSLGGTKGIDKFLNLDEKTTLFLIGHYFAPPNLINLGANEVRKLLDEYHDDFFRIKTLHVQIDASEEIEKRLTNLRRIINDSKSDNITGITWDFSLAESLPKDLVFAFVEVMVKFLKAKNGLTSLSLILPASSKNNDSESIADKILSAFTAALMESKSNKIITTLSVDLSGVSFKNISYFLEALKQYHPLKTLELKLNLPESNSSVSALLAFIKQIPNSLPLSSLKLGLLASQKQGSFQFDPNTFSLLLTTLENKGWETLTELEFSNCGINFAGVKLLTHFLSNKNCRLKKIAINDNPITELGALEIVKNLTHCRSLTALHMAIYDSHVPNNEYNFITSRVLNAFSQVLSKCNLCEVNLTAPLDKTHNYESPQEKQSIEKLAKTVASISFDDRVIKVFLPQCPLFDQASYAADAILKMPSRDYTPLLKKLFIMASTAIPHIISLFSSNDTNQNQGFFSALFGSSTGKVIDELLSDTFGSFLGKSFIGFFIGYSIVALIEKDPPPVPQKKKDGSFFQKQDTGTPPSSSSSSSTDINPNSNKL